MRLNDIAALGILCGAVLIAGCGPSRPGQPEAPRSPNGQASVKDSTGHTLRPGDQVMLTKLGYGCKSRNVLARAVEEQNLGKMPDLQATIGNFPECITQNEFPAQRWTVTAVHPPLVQIGVVKAEDVSDFQRAASVLGKPHAENYKNRYWIPPQWLLKLHPR